MCKSSPTGFLPNDAVELSDEEDVNQVEEEHHRIHSPVRNDYSDGGGLMSILIAHCRSPFLILRWKCNR